MFGGSVLNREGKTREAPDQYFLFVGCIRRNALDDEFRAARLENAVPVVTAVCLEPQPQFLLVELLRSADITYEDTCGVQFYVNPSDGWRVEASNRTALRPAGDCLSGLSAFQASAGGAKKVASAA